MRRLLQIVSWVACAATILPSTLYLMDKVELPMVKWLMLLATIVWFAVTPFWMGREQGGPVPDGEQGA